MEMEINKNMSICDIIAYYMSNKKDAVASLKEIYLFIKDKWIDLKGNKKLPTEETIRAAIYKAPKKYSFERIGKGLYFLKGNITGSLLIRGDSRKLSEIKDNSIDCIITDHPWKDVKAHKSGNQKNFASYETFEYTLEDFKNKSRVLKDGAYLAEFLPIESATNWEYLSKIKNMAKDAGLQYYCQLIWRKAPEGSINTGRTTKGVEQILIFSKNKPRRLSPKGKPYLTKEMLSYEIDIPANKGKEKNHQAEKPIQLYEYLISNLTEEGDVCLDQFGGSCNLLQASINTNRWGIVYEKCEEFVDKATDRFDMITLFNPKENNIDTIIKDNVEDNLEDNVDNDIEEINNVDNIIESIDDKKEIKTKETITKNISSETTDFQYKHLLNCIKYKKQLFDNEDISLMNKIEGTEDIYAFAYQIDKLFNKINERGYKNYKQELFNFTLNDYIVLNPLYEKIDEEYKKIDTSIQSYYLNVKFELQMFVEYSVAIEKKFSWDFIISNKYLLDNYIEYLKKKNLNYKRTENVLNKFFKRLCVQ